VRFSKEIKAGLIAVFAIDFLVAGVNFLKGNSFFGGDRIYYAYFPNSGQIAPSNNVTLNGVIVGKVMTIEYVATNTPDKKVKVGFSIAEKNIQIPKGSRIEIGSLDLLNKGMLLFLNPDLSKGFVNPGETIEGKLSVDMFSQVKAYADPISQKLQTMMASIDKMVNSLSAFWDNSATSEIEASLKEVKIAIARFGSLAKEMQAFVGEEKLQIARIMSNVENITLNLKKPKKFINLFRM
jgi:phospholipid/cholesterol/gamma-HCH transport system substrate-binding protein